MSRVSLVCGILALPVFACASTPRVGFTASQDLDEDGIADRLDNCPLERGGGQHSGCPTPQKVSIRPDRVALLEKVYFKRHETGLRVDTVSEEMLRQAVAVLGAHPRIRSVTLVSHTDDQTENGKALTVERANAVVTLFRAEGLTITVDAIGSGSTVPLELGDTPTARAANNRIEILF